jgi:ABC-type transport system involved in multi-copper enzyme maturation permease subunit
MTSRRFPNPLQVVAAVARVTFREILRENVLYNIFLFAILLLAMGFLASRMTYVRPERIIQNFGISAITLCCAAVATLMGAALLNRELERRTIYVALSHPISRLQFIVGKFTGLSLALLLNWALLSVAFLLILSQAGDVAKLSFHPTLFWALALVLAQSIAMAAIAVLLSTFATTSVSVVMAVGLFLVGSNVSQLRFLAVRSDSGVERAALETLAALIPNFERFALGTKVTYGIPVPAAYGFTAFAYAGAVVAVALLLAGVFLQAKEV